MFDIHADVEKNRLYIILGNIQPGESAAAVEAVRRETRRLVRGFTVLSDLTEYVAVSQEEAFDIARAQAVMIRAGMGKAVRVVSSVVGRMQFERLSKSSGYATDTVYSREEAEQRLDRWEEERRRRLENLVP